MDIDSLFEATKGRGNFLKDYLDRFEAILLRIKCPKQHLLVIVFSKGLLA